MSDAFPPPPEEDPPRGGSPPEGPPGQEGSPGDGPPPDRVGSVLAQRYRILRRLGVGAMGEVYLGEHLRMGRRDAIKLLRAGIARDPESVARFTRGARNVARIRHPHVCQVYDFGETEDGALFLAMEYVDGGSLGDHLRERGALPPEVALRFLTETASALDAAHALGIVHRDLKPDNLMLSRLGGGDPQDPGTADLATLGQIKVVDFDIARGPAEEEGAGVTRHGFVVGTPEYMSPEQLTGDPLDARSDVYALTLILVRMLTGRLPFPGTTAQEVMLQRLTEPPAPLASLAPAGRSFPAALEAAVQRGLARRAEDRTPTAGTLAAEVAQALAGEATSPPLMPPPHAAPPATPEPPLATAIASASVAPSHSSAAGAPRGKGVLLGGAALLLVLVFGGLWWAMSGSRDGGPAPVASGPPLGEEDLRTGEGAADASPSDPAASGEGAPPSDPGVGLPPDPRPGGDTSGGAGTEAGAEGRSGGEGAAAPRPSAPAPTGTGAEGARVRLAIPPDEARPLLIRQFGAQDDSDGPVSMAAHRAVRDTTLAVWALPGISRADSALAAHVLGISLVALGDRDEGLRWLDRAVQVEPLQRYQAVRDALRRGPR